MFRNIFFVAWNDLRNQFRDGSTLLWVFVMPPIFFYFLGTVTSGMSSGFSGASTTPIVVAAERPGFLKDQIDLRLRDNNFEPEWVEAIEPGPEGELPFRTLTFAAGMTERVIADEEVLVRFETQASSLSRESEIIAVQRSLYTALADIVVVDAGGEGAFTAAGLAELNATPRIWQLSVEPAGKRQEIPRGFEQTIPGILVMFTILVLLTTGGSALVIEREHGLLRRLASAPISRTEVVAGKWGARMGLAAIQIIVALAIGTWLFSMDWGPDLGAIAVILVAWAGFCASAGLLLGTVAKTEAQATGLGVLVANVLAALGGCWWPIEITPEWMQALQNFLPTGWTMDALHKLISFQSGAMSALPQFLILIGASLVLGWLAVRQFRYQ
ncbi:MAG: ABC transporter permease [Woeseiaceae bacterium]|nr:ABC transporter permease [Woeseiaceae bacterium]